MTWTVVAGQDVRRTVGTRSVKLLLGLLTVGVLLAAYVYPEVGAEPITTARFPEFVLGLLTTLVPIVGILIGYSSVASELESGELRLSLSFPQDRADVALGKYASRTALLTGTTLLAMVGAGILVVYPFGELVLLRFLGFVVLAVAFAAIWSGIGLAVSLAVATKRRALVLGVGLLFLFVIVWDSIATALELGLNSAGLIDGELPTAIQFVFGLEPGHVFERLTTGFILPESTVHGPWYLGKWVAMVLFVLWVVGPLGLAYLRFERRDIS